MDITIIVDTREQRPYEFTSPTEVGTLSIGDYSLKGFEDLVAIERKTLNDLIGCLTKDRERFEKELLKGRALDYFALIIEASLSDLVNGRYKSKMLPKSAIQSLLAFSVRYRFPIWLCGNRAYSERVTEGLLTKFAREIEKHYKTLTSNQGKAVA